VLPLLRARTDHMAIVVDEFGSAIGILSMEDIFEEVVGTVDSGYDFDTMKTRRVSIESINDDTHLISGRAPISELNDSLKLNLPVGEAHTLAGFLINRLRHIPEVGDTVHRTGVSLYGDRSRCALGHQGARRAGIATGVHRRSADAAQKLLVQGSGKTLAAAAGGSWETAGSSLCAISRAQGLSSP
jgi:hypothetical protein